MWMIPENINGGRLYGDYKDSKVKYFSLLSRAGMPKGKSRAFVGAYTAVLESRLLSSGHNEDEAHITAFSMAVDALAKIRDRDGLNASLSSAIGQWRSMRPGTDPLWEAPTPESQWQPQPQLAGRAISLFSGAMGLDLGFMDCGIQIALANDIDRESFRTVNSNLPDLKFLNEDIDKIEPEVLIKAAGVSPSEVDILIGGPPCQPFSPAGRRAGLNDPRASPLKYFIRAIREVRPAAFVMEEVPGLLSSRLKHFPYYDKYKRKPDAEEERGSAFRVVKDMLDSTGYRYAYSVLNAADYGAPQVRERLIFIGMRDGTPSFPEPTHSGDGSTGRQPWVTFWEVAKGLKYTNDKPLRPEDRKYMSYVPPGGNWTQMPDEIAAEAMGRTMASEGGRTGFYRRIPWDEPSPTVVTSPSQRGTYLVHPHYDRFLSLAEYKVLQGFPVGWKITGSVDAKYRLIGNAVPVHLSNALARHAIKLLNGEA